MRITKPIKEHTREEVREICNYVLKVREENIDKCSCNWVECHFVEHKYCPKQEKGLFVGIKSMGVGD